MLKKVLITLFTFISLSSAHAEFLIEPYVGHSFAGSYDNGTKYDASGLSFGGRTGYQYMGIIGGLSLTIGSFSTDATAGATAGDFDKMSLGMFVGYEFPILLRVFGTLYIDDRIEDENSTTYKGSGFSFGIGYTGLPVLALNFEVRSFSYDKYEDSSNATGSLATDYDSGDIFFSISVPYTL